MESYTRETQHEKHFSYQPGSLEARLNGEDVIPTTKEEEWISQKKKKNNKTRQVETRVQRQLLMEDGKVIADSGPKVHTRTKEMNEHDDSENESKSEEKVRKQTYEDGLFEKLKKSDEYIQLPHQDQIFSEKVHRSNKIRECKQENYRFHKEDLKELDALDIHRTATISPEQLLRANTKEQDSLSDSEQDMKHGKFEISKRNRGKLTHYSSKSYKIIDNDEEREIAEYDENGQLIKKRFRTHNHELTNDDEVPELQYDHQKYLRELKEVSGENFIKIPPTDYENPPKRPLRLKQRSSSLNNLKQDFTSESYNKKNQYRSNFEFQEHSEINRQGRSRHRSSERLNDRFAAPVLTYRDRSESRQSSIVNGNFEEKVNITETESYSNHTDNWLDNHFGHFERPSSRKQKDKYRSSSCGHKIEKSMEHKEHHQKSSYVKKSNQDACVQVSFESDESDKEINRLRSSFQSRPLETYYFGERESKSTRPLKSALKSKSITSQRGDEQKLDDRFNSIKIFNDKSRELVHPIFIEKDDNDNYLFRKQVRKNSYKKEDVEPRWNKADVRSYAPDFIPSPYIRGCSPPLQKNNKQERIIPLRTQYSVGAEKPPVYSTYRSLNRSTNFRSNTPSDLRTHFPEFSSLNSPSKITSTLRR